MPKHVDGIYIKTERSIKKLIEFMQSKNPNEKIIIFDIDDCSCIINSDKNIYKKVMDEIDNCQNKYLFDA